MVAPSYEPRAGVREWLRSRCARLPCCCASISEGVDEATRSDEASSPLLSSKCSRCAGSRISVPNLAKRHSPLSAMALFAGATPVRGRRPETAELASTRTDSPIPVMVSAAPLRAQQ